MAEWWHYVLSKHLPNLHFLEVKKLGESVQPLFEYNQEENTIELQVALPEDITEQQLDLLFAACDTLNQNITECDTTQACPEPSQGSMEISYTFSSEDPEKDTFLRLAKDLTPQSGFLLDQIHGPAGTEVIITISFTSDYDYQQKADSVKLLRDLARRQTKGLPFKGLRL